MQKGPTSKKRKLNPSDNIDGYDEEGKVDEEEKKSDS